VSPGKGEKASNIGVLRPLLSGRQYRLPAVARQSNEIYLINIFTNVDFEGKKAIIIFIGMAIPAPGDTAQSGDYQE
jgi:hypothetical protein